MLSGQDFEYWWHIDEILQLAEDGWAVQSVPKMERYHNDKTCLLNLQLVYNTDHTIGSRNMSWLNSWRVSSWNMYLLKSHSKCVLCVCPVSDGLTQSHGSVNKQWRSHLLHQGSCKLPAGQTDTAIIIQSRRHSPTRTWSSFGFRFFSTCILALLQSLREWTKPSWNWV